MIRSIGATLAAATLVALLAGCGPTSQDSGPPWRIVAEEEMNAAQKAQRDRVLKAKDAMFEALKGRLMDVMASDGPVVAISVCSKEAPEIAGRTAQEHGLKIGRTSFRLRNEKNEPPPWADKLVADRTAEVTYLAHEGRLAALLPIRLKAPCLVCHGPGDSLPVPIRDALAEHYPKDQATGFQEGDLRGWFWVEVPAEDDS